MAAKRRRTVLTFQDKIEIIQELDKGRKNSHLARQYGVGTSTISDIKRNREGIIAFASNLKSEEQIRTKRTRKPPLNSALDSEVYRWYKKYEEEFSVPPSDQDLTAKALEINTILGGSSDFKASLGWLRHFKMRNIIISSDRNKSPQDEVQGEETPERISKTINTLMKRYGYVFDCIYAVNQITIPWKMLPNQQKTHHSDYITVIFCTNASAVHKLPLLVIGNEEKVSSEDNSLQNPSHFYKHKQNSCLDNFLFTDWFENNFQPEVTKRCQNTGNILLVLEETNYSSLAATQDSRFKITYIPQKFSTDLHPLKGVISKMLTINYKRKLLERFIKQNNSNESKFVEQFSIHDCITMLNEAWKCIKQNDIARSWQKLLKCKQPLYDDLDDISKLAEKYVCDTNFDVHDIKRWFDCETDCQDSYDSQTDAMNPNENCNQDQTEDQEVISNYDAFVSLNNSLTWYKNQTKCRPENLKVLEEILELAKEKLNEDVKEEFVCKIEIDEDN